ncbi:MAG TPA: addiction module protein [Longimicrobiaceae bacterium]|nr:addiction module protein [Longimicrobiaceae bacterium]
MATIPLSEILKLSVAERIQLVEDIWDSIAAEPDSVSLTEEQRQELDRRLADQQANPGVGRPWAEVRARLLELDSARSAIDSDFSPGARL